MKRWTRLLLLLGVLSMPAAAWAGHAVLESQGCCPFCDHPCDDCPLMKGHK